MVSCISTTVLSGDTDTGVSFLEHSRKYLNQILAVPNYDTYNNEDDVIPTTEMQSYAPTFGVVGTPSKFSIGIVDPLHFLGVTPTIQNGELLQACKYHIRLFREIANCTDLKIISKYVVSIDGNPSPNYYNDYHV
jgi:hypothetical protein